MPKLNGGVMFSFFKKSPKKPEYTENVWTEKAYKYQALHQDMLNAIDSGEKVFIFTHFEKTLKEICFILEQMKVNFYEFSKGDDTSHISFHQVAIFQANALQKNTIHQLQHLLSHAPASFYIIEHFPTRQNDEELLAALFEINPRSKPVFYTSLDDAVLQQFVTTNLKQVLGKLGMKPEESINHSMVSKSIINAQEKIVKQAKSNRMTYSAEEWLKVNL